MTVSSVRTPKECLERAVVFKSDAEQLKSINSQWYAVAYFYAAFHAIRSALMLDPVFQDIVRLHGFDASWVPSDRFNSHHQARRNSGAIGAPGVLDMVKELYPAIAIEYAQLHSASVSVRYGLGLGGYDQAALTRSYEKIAAAVMVGLAA
ncbi:MAG TPA: hypothetical protein VGM84_11490 [Steroidobacteraceae bacterium]|jgi:hypothetical protein